MAYTQLGKPYNSVMNDYGIYGQNTMQGAQRPTEPDSGALGYATSAGSGAAMGSSLGPYGAIAGAGLGLLQQFANQGATEDAYKQAMAQYNQQLINDADARRQQKENQAVQNMYTDSNFSGNAQDSLLGKYGAYNKMIGR